MKTIVFALQAFGIMALLPVCVALEMNHGTRSAPAIETNVTVTDKTENASVDFGRSIATYPIAFLTLKQTAVKTKKKAGNTCCSCKKCECGSSCKCSDM